jgi:hypothetical protein
MSLSPAELMGALRIVGARSAWWMAVYRMECASGLARRWTPMGTGTEAESNIPVESLDSSRSDPRPFFFQDIFSVPSRLSSIEESRNRLCIEELKAIERGTYLFWGAPRANLGFPPEWNRNPDSGAFQSADRHWTQVPEQSTGDPKALWELSRFSVAFRLARIYAFTGEERTAEVFWQLTESWLETNPPNAGAQWLSAQEVALRLMAWEFGRNAFKNSPATTQKRNRRLVAALGAHARRIEATISYAHAQNNNHLISEAAGLLTVGWMHPQLPGAGRWRRLGRALLEESADQFFADGGYIQHSHNYHRLALQLFGWAMRLAELNGQPFPTRMYDRMRKSLAFLRTQSDSTDGAVPNLGHNDGTHFLPLSDCAYGDYRPLLQFFSCWLEGRPAYPRGAWDEEAAWMLARLPEADIPPADETAASRIAPQAGIYTLAGRDTNVVVRCAHFASRPAHSDQLHVDIRWRSENIACDAGSYRYSGNPPWSNPFADAFAHNTVTVDDTDPMRLFGRFLWTRLAHGAVSRCDDTGWRGWQDGYRRFGIIHHRAVDRIDTDTWLIADTIEGRSAHSIRAHWLMPDMPWALLDTTNFECPDAIEHAKSLLQIRGFTLHSPVGDAQLLLACSLEIQWNIVRAGEILEGGDISERTVPIAIRGWRSPRYGEKIPALSLSAHVRGNLPIRFYSVWIF